jgi:chromosome segregation ATPase
MGKSNKSKNRNNNQNNKVAQNNSPLTKELKEQEEQLKKPEVELNSKDELERLKKELVSLENREKDLNRDISRIKKRNELLEKELEDKYSRFVYQPNKNEMSNLKSSNSDSFREFSVPKFALPEVGTLFENKDSYFLEISDFDELDKANELKKRYTDKNYKVVVKEDNE